MLSFSLFCFHCAIAIPARHTLHVSFDCSRIQKYAEWIFPFFTHLCWVLSLSLSYSSCCRLCLLIYLLFFFLQNNAQEKRGRPRAQFPFFLFRTKKKLKKAHTTMWIIIKGIISGWLCDCVCVCEPPLLNLSNLIQTMFFLFHYSQNTSGPPPDRDNPLALGYP